MKNLITLPHPVVSDTLLSVVAFTVAWRYASGFREADWWIVPLIVLISAVSNRSNPNRRPPKIEVYRITG